MKEKDLLLTSEGLQKLAFLENLTNEINDFTTRLQGETACTCDVYIHVKALRQKLTIFETQTKKKKKIHHFQCKWLKQRNESPSPPHFAPNIIVLVTSMCKAGK